MGCSLLGSSVHEILQRGTLECIALPFSRESSPPRDRTPASVIAGRFFTVGTTGEAPGFPQMQCCRCVVVYKFQSQKNRTLKNVLSNLDLKWKPTCILFSDLFWMSFSSKLVFLFLIFRKQYQGSDLLNCQNHLYKAADLSNYQTWIAIFFYLPRNWYQTIRTKVEIAWE